MKNIIENRRKNEKKETGNPQRVIYIYFIYLLDEYLLCGVGTHQRQERRQEGKNEKTKERYESQRVRPRTPSRVIDALIGDEEQTGKKEREKRKKKERHPNPATLEPSVASYDPQGSYGEPIFFTTLDI